MDRIIQVLNENNIDAPDEKVLQFEKYMDGILSWNEKVNLTAIKDKDEFIRKHFMDSLLCLGFEEFAKAKNIIDVGTGGGFPGVPLAICYPDKKFVLMDSLAKRLKIVKELCEEINIKNVEVVHARAEELGRNKNHREKYDLCVSRAVASMSTLCEYCLPLVRVEGNFIAYKGPGVKDEILNSDRAINLLGGNLKMIHEISNGSELNHNLVFIAKVSNTPKAYPRKAGTPSRNPL